MIHLSSQCTCGPRKTSIHEMGKCPMHRLDVVPAPDRLRDANLPRYVQPRPCPRCGANLDTQEPAFAGV